MAPGAWQGLHPVLRGLVMLGGAIALLAFPFYALLKNDALARNERSARAALKMLVSAEADFRGKDRDGNGIQDYWTADVAGLLAAPGGPLLDPTIAAADTRPQVPAGAPLPRHGYYFRALLRDEAGRPYRLDPAGTGLRNPSKFGFCAYPARHGVTGRYTFLVNEGNTMFREDKGGQPVDAWPSEEQLQSTYTKIE